MLHLYRGHVVSGNWDSPTSLQIEAMFSLQNRRRDISY